jgi:hypothetical protein
MPFRPCEGVTFRLRHDLATSHNLTMEMLDTDPMAGGDRVMNALL